MTITPHDIAALAETRHRDPSLALSMAEQAGKEHDAMNKEKAVDDHFANWRRALAGEKQPIYEAEPWVGYFAVQDRSPGAVPAKGNRWPKVPCAIWLENGEMVAERAGERVPVDRVWPYAASRPITYETYQFWHANERWPDQEKVA